VQPFIDSHAHLADPAFDTDRNEVITRARTAGACGIVCIGESLAAADRAQLLASVHPRLVYFTAGVHPHDAGRFDPARDLAGIEQRVAAGACAIGECGLDYHYDNAPRAQQRHAFESQLALAARLHRPVVVHTRDADDDMGALIAGAGTEQVRGVLHCFTGSHALAARALEAGWFISFSGIVTFKRWVDDALLRLVPDDRLLAESDSPYLAPVPHRGKRNEPAWVPLTLARLAAARGVSVELAGRAVTENARRLFDLS
jgi:TatD DNase family protein